MPRMGTRSALGTRRALLAGLVGTAMAAASLVLAAPAGASNQDVTFTVAPVYFGSVVIGTSTTGASIITNTTDAPLYYIAAHPGTNATGAEYHAAAGTCTGALASGDSCDLNVTFAPNAKGLRASTLTVRFGEENAKGKVTASASFNAALQGRGVPPTFTLTGGSAGDVAIGQIGTVSATVANTSTVPLTFHSYKLQNVVDHNFTFNTTTCSATLLPGAICQVVFTFRPHKTGDASITFDLTMLLAGTKASTVYRQATISGDGVLASGKTPPFELSSLDFGTVTVGTTATGDVVLTNTTSHNETFDSDKITGDKSGAYAITGTNCPSPIPSASSCDLTVAYAPQSPVVHNADLVATVTYVNAKLASVSGSAQTSLTGQGIVPAFALSPSSFPSTTVGASSTGYVTVTNNSLVTLDYASTSFQGADTSAWSQTGSACGGGIAPGTSCNLIISFAPNGQGTLSATIQVNLTLTVRAHTATFIHRAALRGAGTLPTFTITAPTLASTPKGTPVTGQAEITNTSNVSLSYSGYGFTGPNSADFAVTGTTCSGLIGPSDSCDLTVQFDPSASSPGSESASLKVIVDIAGTSPTTSTSEDVAVSGTES
jgi:hypothetical protein